MKITLAEVDALARRAETSGQIAIAAVLNTLAAAMDARAEGALAKHQEAFLDALTDEIRALAQRARLN